MGIIELQGFHFCHAIHHGVIKEGLLHLTSEEAFTPPSLSYTFQRSAGVRRTEALWSIG